MTKVEELLVGKMLNGLTKEIRKFEKSMKDVKWGKANFDILVEHGVKSKLLEELATMKSAVHVETPGEQKLLDRIVSLEERVKGWKAG